MFVTKYVDRNVNKMILQPGLLNTGYVISSNFVNRREKGKRSVEKEKVCRL